MNSILLLPPKTRDDRAVPPHPAIAWVLVLLLNTLRIEDCGFFVCIDCMDTIFLGVQRLISILNYDTYVLKYNSSCVNLLLL